MAFSIFSSFCSMYGILSITCKQIMIKHLYQKLVTYDNRVSLRSQPPGKQKKQPLIIWLKIGVFKHQF